MWSWLRSPVRLLTLVVPGTIAVFVVAHILTVRVGANLQARAAVIASMAERSAQLSSMRGGLLRMGILAGHAAYETGNAATFDATEYKQARAQLESELHALAAELATPTGEVAGGAVSQAISALDRSAARLENGDLRGARAVHTVVFVERADGQLENLILANSDEARRQSAAVMATDRALKRLSPRFDALAATLSLILLLLAARVSRQYARLDEKQKRAAEEKTHELELFAARVAHDLKNPLSGLGLRLSLGRQRFRDRTVASELDKLSAVVGRMNAIIDELLAFARAGGRPAAALPANVKGVVDGVISDFAPEAERAGIELVVAPMPNVEVACPAGALASMVGNLVRNALKFVVEGACQSPRIELRARLQGHDLCIEVSDNGPGIDPDAHQKIFQPFVRVSSRDKTGLGLSLATVRRLVDGYGGDIGLRSHPGAGSCFYLKLPLGE